MSALVPFSFVGCSKVDVPIEESLIDSASVAMAKVMGITHFVMTVLIDTRTGEVIDEDQIDMS